MMIIAVPSAAMAKATVRRMDRRAMGLSLGGGFLRGGGLRRGRSLDHHQGLGAGAGVVRLASHGGSELGQGALVEEDDLDLSDAAGVGAESVEGGDGPRRRMGGRHALLG